jgi:DNA-directed RNA polymerase specialized sigma subunit
VKYTTEVSNRLVTEYQAGKSTEEIAAELGVPQRSVIAKLSSLGVYQKKVYHNKNGELPIKKEVYITQIAELLNANIELCESLEKVNKRVLQMLVNALDPKPSNELEKSA